MEWKELEINNLPSDILTGDYEFEWLYLGERGGAFKFNSLNRGSSVLKDFCTEASYEKLYYRKPEPKQPTHPEIMTKWWKWSSKWFRVTVYSYLGYFITGEWRAETWFTDRESADIPPEESID